MILFCIWLLKLVCAACLGFHQQQKGGSVLQLHRKQIYPPVCGQQPLWPPALPERWSLHVECWIWVPVPLWGRIRRLVFTLSLLNTGKGQACILSAQKSCITFVFSDNFLLHYIKIEDVLSSCILSKVTLTMNYAHWLQENPTMNTFQQICSLKNIWIF